MNRYRVIQARTPDELKEVFRLRYEVYVTERGTLPPDHPYVHGDEVRDPYDAYSTSFLLLANGRPAGTIRCTAAMDGELEIAQYRDIETVSRDMDRTCELTRFMILPEFRDNYSAGHLIYRFWQYALDQETPLLFVAGKVGSLARYYRNFGLRQVDHEAFEYSLVGNAKYVLLNSDFGDAGSLRRGAWTALFEVAYFLHRHLPSFYRRVFKRGLGKRRRNKLELATDGCAIQ